MIEEEVGKKKRNDEEPVMKLYRSSKGSKLQGASRIQNFGFRHDTPPDIRQLRSSRPALDQKDSPRMNLPHVPRHHLPYNKKSPPLINEYPQNSTTT